jgi:hypothetical protein
MLENPSERGLEALLDDTSVEDVLARLERTIWAAQAYTLSQLLERTPAEERSVLDSILEQISWRLGRNFSERRWAKLSEDSRKNLRRLLLAFGDTPFGSVPFGSANEGHSFLLLRATEHEAKIELHHCPHQSSYSEVLTIADELCAIHHHWIRGFAYGLHNRLQVAHERGPERSEKKVPERSEKKDKEETCRCGQRWYFAHVL